MVKEIDQTRLGEHVPTPETANFQEDSHGNFRIVEGKSSEWKKYNEISFLKVEDRRRRKMDEKTVK